jgi:hypothetical protein
VEVMKEPKIVKASTNASHPNEGKTAKEEDADLECL